MRKEKELHCRGASQPSMVRIHGFESPLDPHQVASWVLFGLFAIAYGTLYAPLYHDGGGITVTVFYCVFVVCTIYFGYWSMAIDPSDAGVIAKRAAERAGTVPPPAAPEAVNYCVLCEAHVCKRSKHCRR